MSFPVRIGLTVSSSSYLRTDCIVVTTFGGWSTMAILGTKVGRLFRLGYFNSKIIH